MGLEEAKQFVGKESSVIPALDTVSTSDIRHWRELMEGKKESWNTSVAPPAMTLAWAMPALWPKKVEATEPHEQVLKLLDDAGFGVTVGIGLDQEYLKPVRLGDRLAYKVKVAGVSSSEEDTKYGRGSKVNLLYTFTNQSGEVVSRQSYTILKSRALSPVG
jgi:acyl dehydratase